MNIKKAIAGLLILSAAAASLQGEENLFCNPEFASGTGFLPDHWGGASWEGAREAYKTENGIVRISEKTANYNSSLYQTINVIPGKSYYFAIDMKSDQLDHPAEILYSVLDENGKKLVVHRPLLQGYRGPQKEWIRAGFIIPLGSIPEARKLTIFLCVYNLSQKPGEDRAMYFRKPELTEYTGQKAMPPPEPKTNGATLLDQPFQERFTGFPPGTPYLLEKGGVGFFRLNSKTMPHRDIVMTVAAPEGMRCELYMMKRGTDNLVRIPGEENRYLVGRECDWAAWGNSLIFCAEKQVQDEFAIGMDFEYGGKKISFTVPVKQISGHPGGKLPEKRRYFSWQSMPVTQIDAADPENTLGIRLKEYWERSGWVDLPYVELAWRIPYRWNPKTLDLPQAVDPSGAPVPLYCDSAFAAAGPDFLRKSLASSKKFYNLLEKASYITWDYEPYVIGPVTTSCFCQDCIKAFAKENGLPENLTGEEILKKHRRAWVDFRCRQRAASVRTVVEAVKKINPDAAFGFCSVQIAPCKETEEEYEEAYGGRSRLFDDFADRFETMNYWSNLDFFRSLEREALELKKPKYTLIQNGWNKPYSAPLLGMQYLAAAFCAGEEDFPGIAQGLFISNGEQVSEMRKTMNFIALGEPHWNQGKLVRNTREIREGFNADGRYYALERKAADGRSWSLIFNNDQRETIFLHPLCDPGTGSVTDLFTGEVLPVREGKLTLKLAPLAYQLLEFSPEKKEASADLPDYAKEEETAIENYRKTTSSGSKYGMSYMKTPDKYVITTPVHSLELDLKNSGEGVWKAGKDVMANIVGRGVFMDQGAFELGKRDIAIEDLSFDRESVKVRFSFVIQEPPYTGLRIRREYTLARDTPEIKAYVEIVPEGGYRPFRLRDVNNFIMPLPALPEDPASEVTVGEITDRSLGHVAFLRDGAKLPGGKPFLSEWLKKEPGLLKGDTFAVRPINGQYRIELSAPNVDQLFVWRDKGSASLEMIWPDAYPDNDPHKAATWKMSYSLKFFKDR